MIVNLLLSVMDHNRESNAKGEKDDGYEYLAFDMPEFYLQNLKKECIDKDITFNKLIVDIVGDAIKNWPDNPREGLKLPHKRVTVKVPRWIHNKLNIRKEETSMSIRGSVLLILGLHYLGLDAIRELIMGDSTPPLPHLQRS